MYMLYLQKRKGDTASFKIEKVLHDFWKKSACRNILVSPGHLGYSYSNLLSFYDSFFDNNDFSFGMLTGYLWKRKVKAYPYFSPPTAPDLLFANLIAAYDSLNRKSRKLYIQSFNLKSNNEDHRKMIFLCENEFQSAGYSVVDRSNYIDFVDHVSVKGILIGSSNFSFATYYASPAKKGEADIFMFDNDCFKDFILEEYAEELQAGMMLLNQTIHDVPNSFFNDILKETIASHII